MVIPISVDGHRLQAEVADTPVDRIQGLMYRRNLGQNSGMLFVYERAAHLSFWMKNTWVPLSVAFIDDNGDIVHIEDMDPHSTRIHRSPLIVRYALEVNAGWFSERGIGTTSVVQCSFPKTQRHSSSITQQT